MGRGKGKGPSNARRDSSLLTEKMRLFAKRRRKRPEDEKDIPQPADAGGLAALAPAAPDPAKYLLIEVPNFNNAENEADAMFSYLRLGTVPDPAIAGAYDAPKATGEDLAAHATFFLDDERVRDGSPGFVTPEERQAETARLHTKGGWRDHSDGNRVTTTRGDKVEVIRGNYKLIVLGRQDDPVGAVGWDASGSHLEGVGLLSCIEWVKDPFNGTWRVTESSEKGDTYTTQHGNSVSINYGEIQDSTTGSEDETRPVTTEQGETVWIHAPNPVITNRTWARRIESYTGSSDLRVPTIFDDTWADNISSVTHAKSISNDTYVDREMSSKTIAPNMTDTTISNLQSITIGTVTDLTIGNMLSATVGGVQDITLGALVEVTLGFIAEMTMGGTLTVNLGHTVDLDLSSKTDLSAAKQEVSGAMTRTSAAESVTTGVYTVTAAAIFLG